MSLSQLLISKKWIISALVIFVILQVRLWFSDTGLISLLSLKQEITLEQLKGEQSYYQNQRLRHQIQMFKQTPKSVESNARETLGFVKKDKETFVYILKTTNY